MKFFSKNIKEISNGNRQYAQKRKIVSEMIRSGQSTTIPDLCVIIKSSIPKTTKLVNELAEERLIIEAGKRETENGRRPSLYKISPDFAYTIGVNIQLKGIYLSVFDLEIREVYQCEESGFALENTEACLNSVVDFIRDNINTSGIDAAKILGIGIGITGRVNAISGDSYTFFNSLNEPLSKYLENKLSAPVYIDNDTHVIGLAEQVFGKAKNATDVLIVNLSRGLGLSVITNGQLVGGTRGFAGEFGHMQFSDTNTKLCICGKRGCLGSDVSGYTLEENFREKINAGESSLLLPEKGIEKIQYKNILNAASKGDVLSISLVHEMGFKLGKALGSVINLLNPQMIIVAGKFSRAKEIMTDSIKSGMAHTALPQPLRSCTLNFSSIGSGASIKGAGALVLRRLEII